MVKPTLFLVSVLCIRVAVSELCEESSSCACKFQDGFYVDLSKVGRYDGMARFLLLHNDTDAIESYHLYSYNPCYPISYDPKEFAIENYPCHDVAACVITPGNSSGTAPTQRALGSHAGSVFFREKGFVKINYTVPKGSVSKTLTVTLECRNDTTDELKIVNEASFTLATMCACGNSEEKDKQCKRAVPSHHDSKSGLSTGSILLITFFVILLVYVGFGILFNFCRGAHGTELLPNSEFWNELPKLIVDGFVFTCSCFSRRSTYADV